MAEWVGNKLYMRGSVNGKSSVEIWDDYVKQFGLGVLTGSGLFGESKGIIDYFDSAERFSAQAALVLASFGQQGRYTTLQLAQYTAMLANHGKRMKPQFVNEIKDTDGNVIQGFTPEILNEVEFPAEYWKEIETGMSKVSSQGFEGVDYTYMRKTGTSEQEVAKRTAENAVFIAYAPADKPKLAVAVVIPDGGFGSYGASPIARKIFDAYDQEVGLYGVPKKKTTETNEPNTADQSAGNTADEVDTAIGTTE